jgi:hypothetical protein
VPVIEAQHLPYTFNRQLIVFRQPGFAFGAIDDEVFGPHTAILDHRDATRFRFDPRLTASDADPPDSFFADHKQPEQSGGTG